MPVVSICRTAAGQFPVSHNQSWSKRWDIVKDREAWSAAKSQTHASDWTTITNISSEIFKDRVGVFLGYGESIIWNKKIYSTYSLKTKENSTHILFVGNKENDKDRARKIIKGLKKKFLEKDNFFKKSLKNLLVSHKEGQQDWVSMMINWS